MYPNRTADSWLSATGTAASSGDNTLVAAPAAGRRLVLRKLQVQLEAATATTGLIKFGSTVVDRIYMASAGDGKIDVWNDGRALPEATALVLNLSGANSCGYVVEYLTESI